MKRKLAALLACMLSVSALMACGAEDTTTESGAGTSETVTLAEATITPSVEVVETEGTDLSALPVEEYVTLGDYKNMTISVAPMAELTDAEIEENVQTYFYNDAASLAAESFKTEGTVAEGDVVLIDYEGKKDGVAFDGGTATDATLGIGSGQFIDGFEEGLVGVKAGETVDLNLTFPESYSNTDLAGQAVVFTVTVKGIASLTDEIIASLGFEGIATVAEYKEAVESALLYDIESVYYNSLSTAISQGLIDNCEVAKIPSSIYELQREYITEMVQSEAVYMGTDADTYTQLYTGMTLADYAVTSAESYTIQAVVFQAVANAEGFTVTQEEIDTFVADYVANYGVMYGIDSVDTFYEYNTAEDVKNALIQDKVINFLSETVTITDAE